MSSWKRADAIAAVFVAATLVFAVAASLGWRRLSRIRITSPAPAASPTAGVGPVPAPPVGPTGR